MTIYFYQAFGTNEPTPAVELPQAATVRIWRPAQDGLPPPAPWFRQNLVWWTFSKLGLFAGDGFAELSLWTGDRMAHRLIVTPRWGRFPFMARDDLQIGALWTDPGARGRGLARAAIGEARWRLASRAGKLWCLVDADNAASIGLIEACDFRRIGVGRRTRPFGLRALGRFQLETPIIVGGTPAQSGASGG